MPKVSIALATYNGERYLAAQLDSLAAQASPPSELVVADDCSSDGTMKLIQDFAAKAAFQVHVIRNTVRVGYRVNFMQAAAACSGNLIAFCDQDDIWHAEKLGRMQQPFQDSNVLLAYHNSSLVDEKSSIVGTLFGKRGATYLPLSMRPWTIIPGHTQVIRRSLLRFNSLHPSSIDPYCPSEHMPHDQWYLFWASILGTIVYIPECLVRYRQHGANVAGWPYISWSAYVADHISNAAKYVSGESIGAKNRSDLLRHCRDLLLPGELTRINAAIAYSEALRTRSELRLAIYSGTTLARRARALLALLKQRAYVGRASETLGFPALLLDAAVGVAFGRRASK